MIRISTTTLESFRRVVETEYGDETELIASIKGQVKPTWQMEAGTAWGESIQAGENTWKGYQFAKDDIADARKLLGPGLWEVKGTRRFDIYQLPVEVVAKVDHIRGDDIQENKAKFSPADSRDYESSLQWRFYLAVHEAASVRYNLFSIGERDGDGFWPLRGILSFSFFPYVSLEADCRRWVSRFVGWAADRQLLGFLDREGSTPEAA